MPPPAYTGRGRNARTNAVLSVPASQPLIDRRGFPVVWDPGTGGVALCLDPEAACCGVLLTGDAAIGEHVSIATLGYAGTLMLRLATDTPRFAPLNLQPQMPEAVMRFAEPLAFHPPSTYVAYALEAGTAGAMIEAALLPSFFTPITA